MTDTVVASDGNALPLAALATTIVYSGGFISYLSVQYDDPFISTQLNTYRQTFTNDGTNITAITGWIKQ